MSSLHHAEEQPTRLSTAVFIRTKFWLENLKERDNS
jgi:hypothetical protein